MAPTGGVKLAELPWAERFRPRHLGEIVGNTTQVRKIAEWLRDWDEVVLQGKLKQPPPDNPNDKWKFKPPPENLNARAVLVSGPPGIGKTSTCALVAKCNRKYNVMEYNASDERSKNAIDTMSKSLAGNRTLVFGKDSCLERAVIIMDECDGMAGGGDKGGMAALINMIKTTKNPIICICNDRSDRQVRDLAQVCLDVRFKQPDNVIVVKRIKQILQETGRRVDVMALEAIVDACGHDIRQVLNQVQFFGTTGIRGTAKDTQVMLSTFEATSRLLSKEVAGVKQRLSMDTKFDMFYIDAEMMPLMLQENYLRTYEKASHTPTAKDIENCAKAAELIATADSLSSNFSGHAQAAIGTIYPAFLTSTEAPVRPAFPSWLQKRGPQMKAERMTQEMHSRLMGSNSSCSSRSLATSGYHDVLYRRLIRPLATGDVKACAKLMVGCNLNREFFTDQAPVLRAPLGIDDQYKKIDGKLKTQLLYEIQELAALSAPKKKRRMQGEDAGDSASKRAKDSTDTNAEEEAVDNDEPEDNGMLKARKKTAVKAKLKKGTIRGSAKDLERIAKMSLTSWRKKVLKPGEVEGEGDELDDANANKAGIILKFIEGHTNAVRRKVHLDDFLGPWQLF